MIPDVFGWELVNTRLLADEYAKAGFYVLLPDFFNGDSIPADIEPKLAPSPDAPKRTWFKAVTDTATAVGAFAPWLFRHRETVSRPIIDAFLTTLKSDMPNAKIGAVGFCWGGRYVCLLTHADAKVQVDCAVACHPSLLGVPGEVQKVTKPFCIHVGDQDTQMSVKQADTAREVIKQKGIAGEVTVYPGMTHGFACRGDLSKSGTKEAKENCANATLAWFTKYL